jgi:hypothetical protein
MKMLGMLPVCDSRGIFAVALLLVSSLASAAAGLDRVLAIELNEGFDMRSTLDCVDRDVPRSGLNPMNRCYSVDDWLAVVRFFYR